MVKRIAGKGRLKVKKKNRIGETYKTNEGYIVKIIEYNGANNIIVEFQDEYKAKVKAYFGNLKKGTLRNPYDKDEFGCYIGETKTTENKILKKSYSHWYRMTRRVNGKDYETYNDISMCDEWLCFANFEKWFDENYYELENEQMELDKDILIKRNKIYSPNTCIFVPHRINSLFIKSNKLRGNLPIGVELDKECPNRPYKSVFRAYKNPLLGYFSTPEEAFYRYKKEKEKYIKQIADEYKSKYKNFPQKLYEAMYNWEVDIID